MKKNIICGVITDTHACDKNFETVESTNEQFIDCLLKMNCNIAVHCGDWFEDRFPGNALNSLMFVKKTIQRFNDEGIDLYGIQGNHDKTNYTSHLGYVNVVEDCSKSFKLFTTPGFKNFREHDIRFAFLPYYKEGECLLEHLHNLIEEIKKDNKTQRKRKTILFCHTAISGVKNNDGSLVDNDVDKEFFDFFDLVIVGHYHNRSKIGSKIHYIGSDKQKDFGEDDRKGFCLIYDDLSIEYVQTVFPKFIKEVLHLSNKKEIFEKLKQHSDSEHSVRFIIKGGQQEKEAFDLSVLEKAGIEVKWENTVELLVNFEDVSDAEVIVFNRDTVIKNWKEYSKVVCMNGKETVMGIKALQELK